MTFLFLVMTFFDLLYILALSYLSIYAKSYLPRYAKGVTAMPTSSVDRPDGRK